MPGRRRGRTGRGWDAAPPRPRSTTDGVDGDGRGPDGNGAGGSGAGDRGAGDRGAGGSGAGDKADRTGWAGSVGAVGAGGAGGVAEKDEPVDPAERAREICLRLLGFRPRTRQELATALRQRGIDADIADEVLDRYDEVGIIDDRAFARAWVTSRHHGRGLAGRALADELRRKGVDADAVGEALAEIDPSTEAATARTLVDRKLRGDRGGPPEAIFRRLVGMLARKGYPAGLAIRVVKDAIADAMADASADHAGAGDLADALADVDPDWPLDQE